MWACILLVWCFVAALCGLAGCAPGAPTHTPARVALMIDGRHQCSGVRTAPQQIHTAAHCGGYLHEQVTTRDVAPTLPLFVGPRDVAVHLAEQPSARWTRVAHYSDEPWVRLDLKRGVLWGAVRARSPFEIELAVRCVPGDSGSPVMTAAGVVALVVRSDFSTTCFAELIL